MMRAEELAPLLSFSGKFGGKGSPDVQGPVGFHQGQVLAWNASTGENTVRVLGTDVQDLPVLSVADSILLTEGDTVGILRFKQTYFILGRITPPGAPPRPVFASDRAFRQGFSISSEFTELVSFTFTMPAWASQVIIIANGNGHINNTSGGLANLTHYIEIGGTAGTGAIQAVEAGYWHGIPSGFTVSGDVAAGTVITVKLMAAAPSGWPSHSGNEADLTATAIFGNS